MKRAVSTFIECVRFSSPNSKFPTIVFLGVFWFLFSFFCASLTTKEPSPAQPKAHFKSRIQTDIQNTELHMQICKFFSAWGPGGVKKISVTAERRFVEKLWTVVDRREQITINSSVGWEAGSISLGPRTPTPATATPRSAHCHAHPRL